MKRKQRLPFDQQNWDQLPPNEQPEKPSRPSRLKEAKRSTNLRIIAGTMRSRVINLNIDPKTRPMKDRTREAVFNLIGGSLDGYAVFDLFAGSGILAFEAISRGAIAGVAVEMLTDIAAEIRRNVSLLKIDSLTVVSANVFRKSSIIDEKVRDWRSLPWVVFFCPPYRFWTDHATEMADLLAKWYALSPLNSFLVIELDDSSSLDILPPQLEWDVRTYLPARIAIGQKEIEDTQTVA